jgi:hypothetical protein
MRWLVQNSGVADTFTTKLISELIHQDKTWYGFGCTPDGEKLTGLEDFNYDIPTLVFGSTRAMQIISSESNFKPGVFYSDEWFDPSFLIGKRDDLLNGKQTKTYVGTIRQDWIREAVFIKSVMPKVLSGQVIEPEEYYDWILENERLLEGEEIICSPVEKIEKEWRFFVINGSVVTGSLYRWNGLTMSNEPISGEVYKVAQDMARKFLPHPTITMDICLLRSGEYKLVEFNCIGSSGLYKSDVGLLVRALELNYGNI